MTAHPNTAVPSHYTQVRTCKYVNWDAGTFSKPVFLLFSRSQWSGHKPKQYKTHALDHIDKTLGSLSL